MISADRPPVPDNAPPPPPQHNLVIRPAPFGVGAQVPSSEGLGALPDNLPISIQPIEDGRAVTEFGAWKQAHGELLESVNHLARRLKQARDRGRREH